jgi:hypothetical protein
MLDLLLQYAYMLELYVHVSIPKMVITVLFVIVIDKKGTF